MGLWFTKILLLATHPLAHHQHPEINKHRIVGEWKTEDFAWLIDGKSPPDDLSLWVFRAEQVKNNPTARVWIPKTVQTKGGFTTRFPMTMITLDGICLTLINHPGWNVDHPLVATGDAWELLHGARTGDFAELPLLPMNAIAWRRPDLVVLQDGFNLDGTLPPLRSMTDQIIPADLFDVIQSASF